MKNYCLIFIVLLSALLFSCKEDDAGTSFSCVPINLYNVGCKVVKVEKSYNSHDFQDSYNEVITYTYESDRLVKTVTAFDQEDSDSTVYLYNDKGQLSYLLENKYSTGQLDTFQQYFYGESNYLNKVSFFDDNGSISGSNQFIYSNCKLDLVSTEFSHSESERHDIQLDNEENIVDFIEIGIHGGPTATNESVVITYDNALNPFRYYPDEVGVDILSYFAKRNLTELSFLIGDSISYQTKYSYKYNSQNFPVEIVEVFNEGTIISKIAYDCL